MPHAFRLVALAVLALVSLAPAVEVFPLLPEDVAELDSARDANRLATEFIEYGVLPMTGPDGVPGASWEFELREGSFSDVFISREIPRRFETLRLIARNVGASLNLAVKVADASGAEWTAPPVALAAEGDWQTIDLAFEDFSVANWSTDPDGSLDFPVRRLAVIAFGVSTGHEYALELSRIDALLPDRPLLEVLSVSAPTDADAGAEIAVDAKLRLVGAPLSDRANIVLSDEYGHRVVEPIPFEDPPRQWGDPVDLAVDATVSVPLFAFGGSYALNFEIGEARVTMDGEPVDGGIATVEIKQRRADDVTARVDEHNGVPTLFLNGEPVAGMTYMAYGPSVEVFSDFADAGVRLFSFAATPTESGYGLSRTSWTAPDVYDFSQLDERALMVLEACPDALFFPRIYIHAPKWWSDEHPDDIVLQQNADGSIEPFVHSGGKPAPSWASEAWRAATTRGIERLVEHIEASPYADRVIGYHIASGTTEEWMMWGANEGQWVGYSPANQTKFRAWLRDRYGSDEALRAAWGDAGVTLGSAAVPSRAAREACSLGYLRDPASEQPVIDFYLYNSWMVSDTIATFARETKRIAGRDRLVGVFYGYLLQLIAEPRMQNAGHLALDEVLECPDIDFMTSPTSYMFRDLGTGTSHFMSLTDSVKLHGKLWLDENDIRTSLSPGEVGGWGKPPTIDGDILQQNRELGNVIATGCAQWWFGVGGNRYESRRLRERIGGLRGAAERALDYQRAPADEIAIIVDGNSHAYTEVGAPIMRHTLALQIPEAARIGAPVGYYSLADVPKLGDKKMFVFLNCFAPSDEIRAAIEGLKSDGRVLVFIGPAGVYRDGALDPAAMSDLCGMALSFDPNLASHQCTWTGPNGEVAYGTENLFAPVVTSYDTDAQTLGTLADGRSGLTMKEHEAWTAVHSTAPALPAPLLRELAALAGVHLYTDGDVVWASEGIVSVSVNEAGVRTIRLPRPATVVDLVTGETLATDATEFEAAFAAQDTRTFGLK